jgi:hypothetical protein
MLVCGPFRHSPSTARKTYINRISDALTKEFYSSQMCEFKCNGDNVGCDMRASGQLLQQHFTKADAFLASRGDVREILCSRGYTCTTNQDEHFSGAPLSGLYASDDALVLYYRSDQVDLVAHSIDAKVVQHPDAFSLACGAIESLSPCALFRTKSTLLNFTVFPAHLSSGETFEDEKNRVVQLRTILNSAMAPHILNPVVLMDSNTSPGYEQTFLADGNDCSSFLSSVVCEMGFVNSVAQYPHQCFKLRHAQGGQPKKFGELMFDTIDKILIPNTATGRSLPHPANVFQTLDRWDAREVVLWRTVGSMRAAIKRACIDGKWGPNINDLMTPSTFNPLNGERSLLRELEMTLHRLKMTLPHRIGLSEAGMKSDDVAESARECEFDEMSGDVVGILAQLYPNRMCASDHPPVLCEIEFGSEASP